MYFDKSASFQRDHVRQNYVSVKKPAIFNAEYFSLQKLSTNQHFLERMFLNH